MDIDMDHPDDEVPDQLQVERDRFRAALVALVGSNDRQELEQMEMVVRAADAPMRDKAAMIDAIHALIEIP
jgi:hypothetical protein